MGDPGYFAHPSAVIDEGAQIGVDTRIWHFCHVMAGARIGEACVVGQNCYIGNVRIGRGVKLQNNVSVYDGVELGDEVFCGPSCVFTNVVRPRAFIDKKAEFAPTRVGRGATIGANATIVCGTTIGAYALIGAGAVVTTDVPDFALVLGTPARQRGWVCVCAEPVEVGLDPRATAQRSACAECGREYLLRARGLALIE